MRLAFGMGLWHKNNSSWYRSETVAPWKSCDTHSTKLDCDNTHMYKGLIYKRCLYVSGANLARQCLQASALLEEDPVPPAVAESSPSINTGGADVLQIEDSGDALDIDLDDPFQAQMLDISQPIVADEHMLKCLKQQVCCLWPCIV